MSHRNKKERYSLLLVANYSNQTGYAWNNIYRLYRRIAEESRARGIAPIVSYALLEPPLSDHEGAFEAVLELPPTPRGLRSLLRWSRAIRRYRVRALYLTDQAGWSWSYAAFRLVGVRKIVVHNRVSVADPNPAKKERGVRGFLKYLAARIPFIQATRIYAVSGFVRDRLILKARIPPRRVVTIMNGVNLTRFSPNTQGQDVETRPLQVFCGARASRHKGVQVLIDAAAILLHKRSGLPDFQIVYAGDGPDLQTFRARVDELGLCDVFRFMGQVPSTEALVKHADIIVVPSVWGDACPSTISEAMASGKALIATHVGGVPEMVGAGGAAILIAPGDRCALAAALETLISDPKQRRLLGEKARIRAESTLDERRYHSQVIEQLFSDLRKTV